MPWTCTLCGDEAEDWLAIDNHMRLLHPSVDRDVIDVDGQVMVDAEAV